MATHTFDYVLLGTGQATGTLIGDLLQRGGTIAVVEGGSVGGTCVNVGCTPTKTLIASAKTAHRARTSEAYGVQTGPVEIDFERVMARMNEIRHGSRDGLRGWLESEDAVTLFNDWGQFVGEKEIAVGDTVLTGDTIFINAGGRARVPDIPGLDRVDWLDNRRILELTAVPDHLVIVGGGYIGLEFAQMFRRFGAAVTLLEHGPRIIKREDPDISNRLQAILEDEGIRFLCNATVDRVAPSDAGGVTVHATIGADGTTARHTIDGSHLLVAAGRVPNTDRLDPAAGNLQTNDRGYLVVDEVLRTNVDGIYALGDINDNPGAFTHTAVNDAEIVLSHLFDGDVPGGTRTVNDRALTYALFTDPPLGRVGLTEQQALDQGINLLKATRPMARIARAKEMGETKGLVKLLVDADTDHIVGGAILGVNGDEIINMFTAFMHSGKPCTAYRSVMLVHPTVSELMPWILDDLAPVEPDERE
jgi:pyruvate/2-oxoglutarate dehydrogenase complex dihydrolipoamide dehydrogenase (E3) component